MHSHVLAFYARLRGGAVACACVLSASGVLPRRQGKGIPEVFKERARSMAAWKAEREKEKRGLFGRIGASGPAARGGAASPR